MVEVLVALAISSILLTSLASLVFFSTRSFVALLNYVDLDDNSRRALDVMSRDIRESERLINYSPTQLTFDYTNGTTLKFTYNPDTRTLVRTLNNQSETLLTECDFLQFSIFQRNPVGGTYDQYPTATPATCKLVQLNWVCSRNILGLKANTESVESAKIVIRRE